MKKMRWHGILTVMATCGLAAGTVNAQSMKAILTGNWDDPAIWQSNILPTSMGKVVIAGTATVTLTNTTVGTDICKNLALGDGSNKGPLIIDGGHLTSAGTGNGSWNAIGYSAGMTLTVKNGGGWLCNGRISIGTISTFTGTSILNMETNAGLVYVTNNCQVGDGWTGLTAPTATAKANIAGGILKVGGALNINTNGIARVDISKAGKVMVRGDVTNTLNEYVAKGLLLGNSAVSNVQIVVEVTTNEASEVETWTVVTALVPALPSYVGLLLDVAQAKIVTDGYTVGDLTSTYVRGVDSGTVLSQSPLSGSTNVNSGDPISLTHQEISPALVADNNWNASIDGTWEDGSNWSTMVAPLKETQYYKVNIYNATECVMNSTAAAAWLSISGGNLKLVSGADLYTGKIPTGGAQWTAVGYAAPSTLTIEEGAKMETASYIITGFSSTVAPGTSTINLNGGDLTVGGNIQMGNTNLFSQATLNISSGSVLRCTYFNYRDGISNGTYSVVHLYDGTIIQNLDQTNVLERLIADGGIVVHSPAYSISEVSGKAVLQTLDIGFASWAAQWGTDIGEETEDFDTDGFSNLYEYALDGNPTNNATGGTAPALTEDAGELKFTFVERNDDPKLTYVVETTDSLTTGIWEAVGYTSESARVENVGTEGKYDLVTHTIPVTDAKKFVRLKVVQTL